MGRHGPSEVVRPSTRPRKHCHLLPPRAHSSFVKVLTVPLETDTCFRKALPSRCRSPSRPSFVRSLPRPGESLCVRRRRTAPRQPLSPRTSERRSSGSGAAEFHCCSLPSSLLRWPPPAQPGFRRSPSARPPHNSRLRRHQSTLLRDNRPLHHHVPLATSHTLELHHSSVSTWKREGKKAKDPARKGAVTVRRRHRMRLSLRGVALRPGRCPTPSKGQSPTPRPSVIFLTH